MLFRLFFDRLPGRDARALAWTEQATGALLPGGGAGGLAIGGWLIHLAGAPTQWIVRRSGGLFFLTSAVNAATMIGAGVALIAGASGPHGFARAALPALLAAALTLTVAALPLITYRRPNAPRWVRGISGGVKDAQQTTLREPNWRLIGAIGYLGFDIAVLWICLTALGPGPSVPALVLAYNIGYLANALPIPGGIGVLDAGLTGALALYGILGRGRPPLSRNRSLGPRHRRPTRLPAATTPPARPSRPRAPAPPRRPPTPSRGSHTLRVMGQCSIRLTRSSAATRELDVLDGLLREASRGIARVLVLSGEPGIGKTSMIAALGGRAEAVGCLVLKGRATELERDFPFGLFVDPLDAHLRSLDARSFDRLAAEELGELASVFPALRSLRAGSSPPGNAAERFRWATSGSGSSRNPAVPRMHWRSRHRR